MVEEVRLVLKQLRSLLLHHSFQGFSISSRDTVPGFWLTPVCVWACVCVGGWRDHIAHTYLKVVKATTVQNL